MTERAPGSLPELAATGSYFPALDGLRGVSIMLVVTWHVHGAYTLDRLGGEAGVFVFFVLSGFLITLLLLREHDANGRLALGAFYTRRAFRILPLYVLMLLAYTLLVLVLHAGAREAQFRAALPYYLTFTQEVLRYAGDPFAPFQFTWSLGVEEKFYLLWPALGFVVARTRGRRYAATVIGMVLGVMLTARGSQPVAGVAAAYTFVLIGCLLAQLLLDERFASASGVLASPVAGVAAVALFASDPRGLAGFVAATAAFLLIPSLVAGRGAVAALLATRPLVWLGRISYSIYFANQLSLHLARRLLAPSTNLTGDLILLAAGLAITIPAAGALHLLVERPMQRLGRKWSLGFVAPARG